MKQNKCKICRRVGTKLFLKGERCFLGKCAMVKRPYTPGFQGRSRKRRRNVSEYGKQLKEKQKLRNFYNLKEGQFKKYVKQVLAKRGRDIDTQVLLIQRLEKRLDNVVFRLGFADSRSKARQLVGHCHFLVNGKRVNIPSYETSKGDKIQVAPASQGKTLFQNTAILLKKHKAPDWLKLDVKKWQAEIIKEPDFEGAAPPAEISAIFEYYSR